MKKDIFNEKEFKVLTKSIEANCLRICQLLEKENIQNTEELNYWGTPNKDNVELRQRMKLLRKDTLKIEKLFK